MSDKPIIFSGPMVRALLDGNKTQTRRVVKQKHLPWLENSPFNFLDGKWNQRPLPYGKLGDRLWVKESFAVQPELWNESHGLQPVHYLVDSPRDQIEDYVGKSSIHMPRWASRITLEVTGVRVERLQDISEADAIAEGWPQRQPSDPRGYTSPEQWYSELWESINGPGSWNANPWVWVVKFKRVEGGAT